MRSPLRLGFRVASPPNNAYQIRNDFRSAFRFSQGRKFYRAVSVAAMQKIDHTAIDILGIPRILLMEHAGIAIATQVKQLIPKNNGRILICCGAGFNGGDGLSAARHLFEYGYPLAVIIAGRVSKLREEPATYAAILRNLCIPMFECFSKDNAGVVEESIARCTLIVDALLGIGARGAVREPIATIIKMINKSKKLTVSADIPSGLDADCGSVQGIAVHATKTVAFGLPKRGCFLREGTKYVGSLIVDPITIPGILLR